MVNLRFANWLALALSVGLGLQLAGCQASPRESLPPSEAEEQLSLPTAPSASAETPIPAEAGTSLELAPTGQPPVTEQVRPPVRTELAATDPATVNLASGKPTLVEFFAFW